MVQSIAAYGKRFLRGRDHGDELAVLQPAVIAQKTVDLRAVVLVGAADTSQGVDAHGMFLQAREPLQHRREARLAGLVAAVGIVQTFRPVYTQAHQHILFF